MAQKDLRYRFFTFSIFGFLIYIPSTIMAAHDGLLSIIIANSITYLFCLFITFNKKLNYIFLNVVIVLANAIFIQGFRTILAGTTETRNASIIGLIKLAEHRDTDTGEHLKRIQSYTVLLGKELAESPAYKGYITDEYIDDLKLSSILHDIGKVGIQEAILLKPERLTEAEFSEIKKHPEIGCNVISEIEKNIRGRSLYELAKEIAI